MAIGAVTGGVKGFFHNMKEGAHSIAERISHVWKKYILPTIPHLILLGLVTVGAFQNLWIFGLTALVSWGWTAFRRNVPLPDEEPNSNNSLKETLNSFYQKETLYKIVFAVSCFFPFVGGVSAGLVTGSCLAALVSPGKKKAPEPAGT